MVSKCNFSNILIQVDKYCDLVPILSTLTNTIICIQKEIFKHLDKQTFIGNKYFNYVYHKDMTEVQWLLIPFVGNFKVYNLRNQNSLIPPQVTTTAPANPPVQANGTVSINHAFNPFPFHLTPQEISMAVFGVENNIANPDQWQKYVTYRGLSDAKRQEARQFMYKTLFPLVKNALNGDLKEIKLPCVSGYAGEQIFLSIRDNTLIIRAEAGTLFGVENRKILHINNEISISNTGKTVFKDLCKGYKGDSEVTIMDEKELSFNTKDFEMRKNFSPMLEGEWLFEKGTDVQTNHLEPFYHKGPALLELLTFKWEQIQAFLQVGDQGVAKSVFKNCLEIFKAFKQPPANSTTTLAVPSSESKSFTLENLWSPLQSQDSQFKWKVTHTPDKCKIEFEKTSVGRGIGRSATRELILTQNKAQPDQIEVTIKRLNTDDMSRVQSESSYTLSITGDQFFVQPAGKKVADFYSFMIQRDAPQTVLDMQSDIEFAMNSLTSIWDIYNSPHTVILGKDANQNPTIYNLKGEVMPHDYIKQRTAFKQGIHGYSALAQHVGLSTKTEHGKFIQ